MVSWEFRDLGGEPLVDRNYSYLLRQALKAKPTPHQSNYPVYAAGLTLNGRVVTAGNHEYSLTKSLHAEETLVGRALEEFGEDDKICRIAFADGEPGEIGGPCGNCRDLLRQYADPRTEIIQGSLKGGAATVAPISVYYYDDFEEVDLGIARRASNRRGFLEAVTAEERSHKYGDPRKKYGAVIVTPERTFAGGFEGDVSYHPRFPVANAIANLVYSGDVRISDFKIERLVLASSDGKPEVPYLDRQHFLELIKTRLTRPTAIPIWLFHVREPVGDEQGRVKKAWTTDSDEWLPYGFFSASVG